MKTKPELILTLPKHCLSHIITDKVLHTICSNFPSDYEGWVYLACKNFIGHKLAFSPNNAKNAAVIAEQADTSILPYDCNYKIIARIWCKAAGTFSENNLGFMADNADSFFMNNIIQESKLTVPDLIQCLKHNNTGTVLSILKLETFAAPKDIRNFISPTAYNKYLKELHKLELLGPHGPEKTNLQQLYINGNFSLTKLPKAYNCTKVVAILLEGQYDN